MSKSKSEAPDIDALVKKELIQIRDGQMFAELILILDDLDFNVRQNMGDMEALADDIAANGIRVPLEIRMGVNDTFILVDGHRRKKAAYMRDNINLKWVPVQFEKAGSGPVDRLASMYSRNTGKPLEPMEEWALFQRMVDLHFKPKEIAVKIGRSLEYVNGRLALGKASEDVKDALRKKKITAGTAKALAKQPKEDQAKAVKAARETSGGRRDKSKAAKAAAGIKSMRTEKEIRIRLKRYRGAKGPYDKGWLAALGWVLGEMV